MQEIAGQAHNDASKDVRVDYKKTMLNALL
jgi:hypothetical protein